ncbi:hypothetical protein [Streptomyces avermitilis]|uniref:hypothetical protein n=1 Tax=Streptomyces avermitilis TaxID=33903 RepID=UPI0033A6DE32
MTLRKASDFIEQLRELRLSVGQPSMRHLQRLGGQTRAANGDAVDALPRSTVSTVLRGNKLPRSEFVSAFVTACLVYGGEPPEKVAEETERWLARWRVLYAAEAKEGPEGETAQGDPVAETPKAGSVPPVPVVPPPHCENLAIPVRGGVEQHHQTEEPEESAEGLVLA